MRQFKQSLQQTFSNSEIFEIFKGSKRILLFLFNEKVIIIDEYIVFRITSNEFSIFKYCEYFEPEIKPFLTKEFIEKYEESNLKLGDKEFIEKTSNEFSDEFYNKRNKGENDNFLSELIRTNQVKEFGIYVNRNNISPDSYIEKSIFETNKSLFVNKSISLIEYASFYGSIEIIRYMRFNFEVELTSNMWLYAIHSCNEELIKYLEDNHVSTPGKDYEKILKESIKCHHNNVSKYIIDY